MKKYIILGIIALIAIVLLFSGCGSYNGLVTQEEAVDKSWAEVQVQYQRRYDLIPQLVNTVKGYAAHESATFQNVTNARAGLTDAYRQVDQAADGQDPAAVTASQEQFSKYTQAQSDLSRAFNVYVNAVREAYPDLKADKQFLDLQTQLEGTGNRIAFCRGEYTQKVMEYNLKVKKFPGNIWAMLFGFSSKPQYAADTQAAQAVKVEF